MGEEINICSLSLGKTGHAGKDRRLVEVVVGYYCMMPRFAMAVVERECAGVVIN